MRRKRKGLSMYEIRDVLRMGIHCKCGVREIARTLHMSHSTVSNYLQAAKDAHIVTERLDSLSDDELMALIRPKKKACTPEKDRPLPDCEYMHQELKKKHVTISLLWHEYKEQHPKEGYQLSQFSKVYRTWLKKQPLSMRQYHKAGEKMFVDYAGSTIPIRDSKTGTVYNAAIFVAVLGASNYTYVEASRDQSSRSWIRSHTNALTFFGGSSRCIVPDNLKSGVTRACRYEAVINRTYQEMAYHYGTAIVPARVRKPKDKSKVETGVLIASRWIIAALRNRTFYSLEELNEAISLLLDCLNNKPMQKCKKSRYVVFQECEQAILLPLPETRYVFAKWKKARANIDYHIECEKHYYSVPYKLRGELMDICYTDTTVEIIHRFTKVATHMRSYQEYAHTTINEHMPRAHQAVSEWTPSRMIAWAKKIGPHTAQVIETILNRRQYPEHGYRSCLGILRLEKEYSSQRLEKATERACLVGTYSRKSIKSILACGLDTIVKTDTTVPFTIAHENIRGEQYFTPQEVVL